MNPRKYLRRPEVDTLLTNATTSGRYGQRNRLLLLMMYRHGLRPIEAVSLRWDDVCWEEKTILIRRAKRGLDSVHPLSTEELHCLQQLHGEARSPYVFESERGTRLSTSSIAKLVTRISAGMGVKVQPKSLRHGCGYALANANIGLRTIMDYMGHRSASSSVLYTVLAAERFKEAANVLGRSKGANAPRA